ncbi:MAG TPA: type II secretion system protein GspM [Alphaproteobacteria bacterium]
MTLPDGRAGRILALAMAGGLLALAYLSAVRPLVARHGDMREELSDLALQRARLRKIEGELPRLQATIEDMKRRAGEKSLLLSDPSDAVAAASLQTRLQGFAAGEGAEVSSVESLSPKVQEGFRRVGVRAVITCDLGALTAILRALSVARPPLFVENIDIRNNGIAGRQAASQAPALNISFDVYGFRPDGVQTQTVVSR